MNPAKRSGGIGLEYLSVFGMPIPAYVALAARLGCDFVSVNFGRPANAPPGWSGEVLRESASLRRALGDALADHGLRLELVEGFAITPDADVSRYAAELDAAARLGARSICGISLDKDRARTEAQFARLASMAAERGLRATTEVGAGVARTFEIACAIWRAVDHPSFALLIDTMHFFRSGATVADLDRVPAGAIAHVQLCDVPMPATMSNYMEEALFDRLAPGDGDLPLGQFLARLSGSVPVGLEAPIRSGRDNPVKLEACLQRCVERTRALCETSP